MMTNEIWIVSEDQTKAENLMIGSGYEKKYMSKDSLLASFKQQDHIQIPILILIDCKSEDSIEIAKATLGWRDKLHVFGPIRSPMIDFLRDEDLGRDKEELTLDFIDSAPDSLHMRDWKELEEPIFFAEIMKIARNRREGLVVGRAPAFLSALKIAERFAPTDLTVLITGESGTGKGLLARSIHFNSPRSHRPCVRVDCASLVENLLETELFGTLPGAFTGALKVRKKGLFEAADGGTIFLDEVANTNLATQAKLLQFLEDHEIKPVGGTNHIKVDVRVIAATNQRLEPLIEEKKFRNDLFQRLNYVSIELPELRNRRDDILFLAMHFLRELSLKNGRVKNIDQSVECALLTHSWPGNVRELSSVLEFAFVNCQRDTINLNHFPRGFREAIGEKGLGTKNQEMTVGILKPAMNEVVYKDLMSMTDRELREELNPKGRKTLTKDRDDTNILKMVLKSCNGSPSRASKLFMRAGFEKNVSSGAIRNVLGESKSKKALVPKLRDWYLSNFRNPRTDRIRRNMELENSSP